MLCCGRALPDCVSVLNIFGIGGYLFGRTSWLSLTTNINANDYICNLCICTQIFNSSTCKNASFQKTGTFLSGFKVDCVWSFQAEKLRHLGHISIVEAPVITSYRRWRKWGYLKVSVSNLALNMGFSLFALLVDGLVHIVSLIFNSFIFN